MGRIVIIGGVAAGAALLSLRSKASAAPRPADDDNIPEADDEGYWQYRVSFNRDFLWNVATRDDFNSIYFWRGGFGFS